MTRDLNDRQSRLCVRLLTAIRTYEAPELHPVIDQDLADAADALASTFETAAKGVIYEHRPASLAAERLAAALKSAVAEAERTGGTPFQRDAATVLRRIAEAARDGQQAGPDRKAFIDLIARVVGTTRRESDKAAGDEGSRLILP